MNILATTTLEPDDLLRLPDSKHYELIDGHPVEKHVGSVSSFVGGRIFSKFDRHLEQHPTGWLLPADCGFRGFPGRPRLVRKPDVSVIRFGRLPEEQLPDGDCPFPPDLAVEVVSPNDLHDEVERKLSDYLKGGVPLVWVVSPAARTVTVYRADGSARRLFEEDEIDGGDVLPGFRCRVGDFFPPPPSPPPAG